MPWKIFHISDQPKSQIRLALFSGWVLLLYWAEVFSLGEAYGDGKVMATALVLGPLIGLLLPTLGSFSMLLLGKVPFRNKDTPYTPQRYFPPFPLKTLLFRPLLGRKKVNAWFKDGFLKGYTSRWNAFVNRLNRFGQQFSHGKITFGSVFGFLNQAYRPLLWMGILRLIELAFSSDSAFLFELDAWFVLQSILLGITLWRWVALAQKAFFNQKGSIVLGITSFLVAFGLISLLFWGIFALPLVA